MATSKQSFVRATEPQCSVPAQREEETHIQASLTTMYVHSVPAPGLQPYPQAQPGALQDATVVPLFLPRMCSSSALPSLTLHIPSSAAVQQQRLVAPATSARPKSGGKHICPHCGKDCLKPSVLEKHLRCHTGERPYPCTTCGISFKTQSNLYKHKRTQAHARLSSESDKSTFSSQESIDSTKDSCTSPSPEMNGRDSVDMKRNKEVLTISQVDSTEAKAMSDAIDWALHNSAKVGMSTTPAHQDKVNSFRKTTAEVSVDVKNHVSLQPAVALSADKCTGVTLNRTPLQRQEALFSKPSFPFHSKAQSHDSTDSGFSDSSEHHSSLHDPSMESLTEATMPGDSQVISEDPKSKVSIQEKQKLEERISKIIYENSVLVDNKQLENVRPRKTVLSKQGSIDLPVPYTYKDSFHFEIRNSKHILSSQNQDRGGGAIHIAASTQHSASLVHAPLTRSSSLPFTMGGKPADGAINLNLSRRCSAGHVYPHRSPDQQATGHRSLVRQAAVDCLPSAEGSLVERGSMSSLSSDGDSTDVGTEPCMKGNYRKKARKFDYTKWHTYKGGTFRKLYNSEKDCPLKMKKTASISEPSESLDGQKRENGSVSVSFSSGTFATLQNDLTKVSYASFENNNADMERNELVTPHTDSHIPSERKKLRTGNDVHMLNISDPRTTNVCGLMSEPLFSTCTTSSSTTVPVHPQGSLIRPFSNSSQFLGNTLNPAICFVTVSGTSGNPSASINTPTVPESKTSFPPMYQLKIPCSTDGVPSSCSCSTLAHSPVSVLRKSHKSTRESHHENCFLSSKQCQSASVVTTFDQNKQDVLCATTSIPTFSVSCSGLNQTNTFSKVLTQLQSTTPTSVSSVLPSPVQHQVSLLQSNCANGVVEKLSSVLCHPLKLLTTPENTQPVTSMNTTSRVNNCAEIHSSVSTTDTVPNLPPFPVTESGKQNVQRAATESYQTLNSTASKLPTSDFQSPQSEEKLVLLNGQTQAQNMFYVRTADLQIFMQLISDEQLALIEPHIETASVNFTNQTSLSQEVCRSDMTLCAAQEIKNHGHASSCCEFYSSVNKAKTIGSLSPQTDQNYAGTIPQCVSSWSYPQTKFHVSNLADYNTNSTQEFHETQKTLQHSQESNSAGFEVTTDSHYKLMAGDSLRETHLLDKSFSRREHDKDCIVYNIDTDRSSEDQTNPEIIRESNHNQTTKYAEIIETSHLMSVTCQSLNSSCKPGTLVTETLRLGQTTTQDEFQASGDFVSDTHSPGKVFCLMPDRTSNVLRVPEDGTKCGNVHTHHADLEIFTGFEEDGALQSLRYQKNNGTERNQLIPKEHRNDCESTGKADTSNKSQVSEGNGKQDKRKEETKSCKEHQTSAQPNLHLSQEESFNIPESFQPEKNNPETSARTIILSQTCQHQGQGKCNNNTGNMGECLGNNPSQETGQQEISLITVSKYSNQTCRHPSIENTTQCEFQKETQARGATSYRIYSKGSQKKMSGTTVSASVLQNNAGVIKTETLQGSITSPSSGPCSSNGSNQMFIQEPQTSPTRLQSYSAEPKHLYLGNTSYLEQEDSNSSSDDEQKLVIELE